MKALSQKRRHPLAAIALLLMGLLVTGGLYAVATTVNQAKADTTSFSASDAEEGGKLFAANCATCHGMGASGSQAGPSLVGVGAAAVDFQVGTGRMPMQMNGPQAYKKPAQFNEDADPPAGRLRCLARRRPVHPRRRMSSTRRATPPRVASCSAPTAPCATTLQPPAAR